MTICSIETGLVISPMKPAGALPASRSESGLSPLGQANTTDTPRRTKWVTATDPLASELALGCALSLCGSDDGYTVSILKLSRP